MPGLRGDARRECSLSHRTIALAPHDYGRNSLAIVYILLALQLAWLAWFARWLGNAMKSLTFRNLAYIEQFLIETRREEVAHWCAICCLPLFFL
jgi:hypothetical protein